MKIVSLRANNRGEVALPLTLLAVVMIAIGIGAGTIATQKETRTTSMAAETCAEGAWINALPTPAGSADGYKLFRWKNTSCAASSLCHVTSDCDTLKNTSQPDKVDPNSSYGCYGYQGSNGNWDDFRCIHVVAVDAGGNTLAGYQTPSGNSRLAGQAPQPSATTAPNQPTSPPAPTSPGTSGDTCADNPWQPNGGAGPGDYSACGSEYGSQYAVGNCGYNSDVNKWFLCRVNPSNPLIPNDENWYGPCNTETDCNAAKAKHFSASQPTTPPSQPTTPPASQATATPIPGSCLIKTTQSCTQANTCTQWSYGGVSNEFASWVGKYFKCQTDSYGQFYWYGPCNTNAECMYISPTPAPTSVVPTSAVADSPTPGNVSLPATSIAGTLTVHANSFAYTKIEVHAYAYQSSKNQVINYSGTSNSYPYELTGLTAGTLHTLDVEIYNDTQLLASVTNKVTAGTRKDVAIEIPAQQIQSRVILKVLLNSVSDKIQPGTNSYVIVRFNNTLDTKFPITSMSFDPTPLRDSSNRLYQSAEIPVNFKIPRAALQSTNLSMSIFSVLGNSTTATPIPLCGGNPITINSSKILSQQEIQQFATSISSTPITVTINCNGTLVSIGATTLQYTPQELQKKIDDWNGGILTPLEMSRYLSELSRIPRMGWKFCDPQTGGCTAKFN